jgi:putative ABC transport system permease protein
VQINEILTSIRQHKLRNALTGFGVAWGIFILMLMMGFGESFQKGIFKIFNGYADNTIWVWGGETSLDYQGRKAGKSIGFDLELLERFQRRFSEIQYISPESNSPQGMLTQYQENNSMNSLKGVSQQYFEIKKLKLSKGRYFNASDFNDLKPVCIIMESNEEVLFKKKKNVIGEFINVGGTFFQVVGVAKTVTMFDGSSRNSIFITYPYFKSLYNEEALPNFMMSLHKNVDGPKFDKQFKNYVAQLYGFDPEDSKALFTYNLSEQVSQFQALFGGVKIFVWFIGFCILLTGIISIGNIMYVNINERTREIGIRKAIGASPRDILKMILSESVVLTTIAGMVGIFAGAIVIFLLNFAIQKMSSEGDLIRGVGFNIPIIITAFLILIVSGVIAGIMPARKAANIKPVWALNQES